MGRTLRARAVSAGGNDTSEDDLALGQIYQSETNAFPMPTIELEECTHLSARLQALLERLA